MTVFVGRRLCDEKYEGGPDCEPIEEKTLVGPVADCELSCEKLRAEEVVKAAANGDILEVARAREDRSNAEAVPAASRVRDAIVGFVQVVIDDGHAKLWASVGEYLQASPTATLHKLAATPS